MTRILGVVLLLAATGCAGVPRQPATASPCAAGEATYACQVERYNSVATQ